MDTFYTYNTCNLCQKLIYIEGTNRKSEQKKIMIYLYIFKLSHIGKMLSITAHLYIQSLLNRFFSKMSQPFPSDIEELSTSL